MRPLGKSQVGDTDDIQPFFGDSRMEGATQDEKW